MWYHTKAKLTLNPPEIQGGRRKDMKQGIHPKYGKSKVICTSCGAEFESGSIKQEIKVDTCSNCHPFYTGKQRFAQVAGRVERFNKKYGFTQEQN